MIGVERVADAIDGLNEAIGRVVAWSVVLMVIMQFCVVVARYVFSTSSLFGLKAIWLQEGIVYLHALTIMAGAGYAFLHDGHVRVDVFREEQGEGARDWTDLLGCVLFVMPVMAVIAWSAWPNVVGAWMALEGSIEPDGLPLRYVLKSLVLLFALLIALQALAIAARAFLRLTGRSGQPVYRGAERP